MPSEVGRPIYLDRVALDFPDLVIVGASSSMWNSRSTALDSKQTTTEAESSDFFPELPSIKVERPASAYVEFRESNGAARRIKASGGTLRCILHCQEVLSGTHLSRFVEAQRSLKKMRKG